MVSRVNLRSASSRKKNNFLLVPPGSFGFGPPGHEKQQPIAVSCPWVKC